MCRPLFPIIERIGVFRRAQLELADGADVAQADRRFFQMLKKHFDSEIVDNDKPGERERYQREGVTLLRLTRRL
jgi:hypothetical protein